MHFTFASIQADSILNREFLLVLVTANRSLCYTDATCKSLMSSDVITPMFGARHL